MFTKCCTCYHELSSIFDNFIEHFVHETIASLKVEFAIKGEITTKWATCFYFSSKLIFKLDFHLKLGFVFPTLWSKWFGNHQQEEFSQIWQQIKDESIKIYELCYILVTCCNLWF